MVQLQAGHFSDGENTISAGGDLLDKDALLVYCGTFQSMDGEVEIGEDHLKRLASNHNSWLSKFKRMATGEIPAKACPPIQLDHSKSARDTVGRLVGDLKLAPYQADGGTQVLGLYGKLRILGKENVEKVKDGRWTHLSIGADLEEGKLTELTITPFPAAPEAAMLRQGDIHMGKLLASSPSLDEIKKQIAKYWYTSPEKISLTPSGSDQWSVSQSNKEMEHFSVVQKGNRFRFEVDDVAWKKANMVAMASPTYKIEKHPDGYQVRIAGGDILGGGPWKTEAEAKEAAEKWSKRVHMAKGDVVTAEHKGVKIHAVDEGDGSWSCFVSKAGRPVYYLKDTYVSAKSAVDEAKGEIDAGNVKMTGDSNIAKDAKESEMAGDKNLEGDGEQSGGVHIDIHSHNEEEGEEEMTEEQKAEALGRLRKHLMESQGLSEQAVDKRMKYMGAAEMKRLTEELNQHTVGLEEKIAKHLVDEYKCTEDEAKEKLKSMADEERKELAAEADARMAKLADAEGGDSDKDGDDKKKLANQVEHKEVGMSADTKKKLTELVGDFRKAQDSTRLAAKKQQIHIRLSALKAEGKITPAEIKGLDIVKLAGSSEEALTLALDTFEKREPQVLTGFYGTVKGEAIAQIKRLAKKNAMAKEMVADMPFTMGAIQMSEADRKEVVDDAPSKEEMAGDVSSEEHNELSAEVEQLCGLMGDAAKHGEVTDRLRKLAERLKKMGALTDDKVVGADSAMEMESAVKEMSAKFDGLMTLVSPVLGLNDNAK